MKTSLFSLVILFLFYPRLQSLQLRLAHCSLLCDWNPRRSEVEGTLEYCFLNFNVHTSHPGILLICMFLFDKAYYLGPRLSIAKSSHVMFCCRFIYHSLNSRGSGPLASFY